MGGDFKSYINNNPNLKNKEKEQTTKEKPGKTFNEEEIAKNVEGLAKEYEGKSEEELVGDILKKAAKGRQDGSIDFSQLDSMAQKIAPMLSSEQQEKLSYIMNLIKRN